MTCKILLLRWNLHVEQSNISSGIAPTVIPNKLEKFRVLLSTYIKRVIPHLKCFIIWRWYFLFKLLSGTKMTMPSFWNLSVKASNSAMEGRTHDLVDDIRMLINAIVNNIILLIIMCTYVYWYLTAMHMLALKSRLKEMSESCYHPRIQGDTIS